MECVENGLEAPLEEFELNRTEKFLPPTWKEYQDRWPEPSQALK